MRADQVYAIVDIEATGGSVGVDERIIQIACVLVENNEIINTFESLVNPGRSIPINIQKLTGISNKDVQKAPYFEEIAPVIHRLLEGAIFVAHNVGFDYRFLNEQLAFHHFDRLEIPAIDTVELTQILYPALDSFQLEEVATSLSYDLQDAHDALADAEATVYLLRALFERASKLPLITLEKLAELADCTTHDTYHFFEVALENARKNPTDLADDLVVVNQLAMRKPKSMVEHGDSLIVPFDYPKTQVEKEKFLYHGHSYRAAQAEMMDLIYDYFQEEVSLEKIAVEVPPGVGKTLGYLFPSSFFARRDHPIVVSTYTTVLQEQLVNESIPQLEQMLKRDIQTVLLKSSRHYLSLSVFERWLKEITGKDSEAYLSMRILVWLTDTVTGDLGEINAGSHLDLQFWKEIRVHKNQYTDEHWKDYDFYNRIKAASKKAELIITNHHFLVHDWQSNQPILTNLDYVVIDEAHHFPDVAVQATTVDLKVDGILEQLVKMGSISNNIGLFRFLNDLYDRKIVTINDLKVLDRTTTSIKSTWTNLMEDLMALFLEEKSVARSDSNFVEHEFTLDSFSMKQKRSIKNILRSLEEFLYVSQEISIRSHGIFKELSNENQLSLIEFVNLINYLKLWQEKVSQLFNQDKKSQNALRWGSYLPENIEQTFKLHALSWGQENSFIDYLATNAKVVFTSSTLSFEGSENYFSEQLKNLPLQYHQLESPFNYGKQVRVILPENSIHPRKIKPQEYAPLLAESISEILKDTQLNSIVLFRSLALLEEVYELLKRDEELQNHMILAQTISGTRNRILKNFKRNRPAVILGADSFFEGIDLPNEELELLILTRLPFPAPDAPLTRLKVNYLQKQSINPFFGEYLPQAVLKFRQAFGRLIRNQTDRGAMIILDERFLSANYSTVFKDALPRGIAFEVLEMNQIGPEVQQFIDGEIEK